MEKIWRNYRKESREAWGQYVDGNICDKRIQLGAILRIADAMEMISQNYQNLINAREVYKRRWEEGMAVKKVMLHQIAGLKGYIGRVKRRNNA